MINHLWQSTVFAFAAGLLTLALRGNRASVRYWLWFSASLKFLIPFAFLISLGSRVGQPVSPAVVAMSPLDPAMIVKISEPFSYAAPPQTTWIPIIIFGLWASGFVAIALLRLRGWRRVRAAIRASSRIEIGAPVEVRSTPGLLEPGVVGWIRPILLLPAGIVERLTPHQLEAVLAHELCHIRRRDNLTAAVHMMVEAIFWFHPLVWWIGARLVDERERACDEEVLRLGNSPHEYAEGILNVCKGYVEWPLRCVAGVTGSDLMKRIHAILSGRVAVNLSFAKKAALVVAGLLAIAAPVVVGVMHAQVVRGTPPQAAQSAIPSPAAAQPERARGELTGLGYVSATTVNAKPRIDGQLISAGFKEGETVQAGQILAEIDPRPYEIELQQAEAQVARDEAQIAEVVKALPRPDTAAKAELVLRLATDQLKVQEAKTQLAYTKIAAPIAGVAGLRQIDVGNIVRASADAPAIVTITQLQPIAVVFNLSEDELPLVRERVSRGANLQAEAWSRDFIQKIATGRLTAIDNQIDQTTGTVKLKATFANSDGALFPNEFVNVRLILNSR
jgi:RND family efflux transporter MFP subunit